MHNDSTMFQRDQLRKPNIQRSTNLNLSQSFPFMEFGFHATSSLDGILRTLDNQSQYDKQNKIQSGLPNFISSLDGNIRNTEFSSNKLGKIQNVRNENIMNDMKNMKYLNQIDVKIKANGIIHGEQRFNNTVLPLKRFGSLSDGDRDPNVYRVIGLGTNRTSTSVSEYLFNNESLTSALRSQLDTRISLKSIKLDDINDEYVNQKKLPKEHHMNSMDTNNSLLKQLNVPLQYLREKKESLEYSRQRMEEANLPIDNIPKLKVISAEDMFTNGNKNNIQIKPSIPIDTSLIINDSGTTKEMKIERQKSPMQIDESDDEKYDTEKKRDFVTSSKNVKFKELVETRQINGDFQSNNELSDTENESESSSCPCDGSQKSGNSMQSDSEDEDSKSSMIHQQTIQSFPPSKTMARVLSETIESEGDSESSSDEEKVDISKNSSGSDCESSDVNKLASSNQDELINEMSQIKVSGSQDSYSRSSSSTSNKAQKTVCQTRIATVKARINVLKTMKKNEPKTKPKSIFGQKEFMNMKIFKETELNMPLIFSRFSNVPPVINFVSEGEKIEQLPWQLRKLLRWRMSLLTPAIVKQTITRSGFRPSRLTTATDDLESVETSDWILYFGKHMKGPIFKTLKEYQKVNHFPGSFQLGRKDRLWRNICKMQQDMGKKEFDFIPQTYCLPADLEQFKQCWDNGGCRYTWIIKPPASARGIGIKVVSKWNQIPKRRAIVIQRYISNPYLINSSKFDLRLYVFLSSVDPLRIYLFEDGLVRFASIKYTNSAKNLHNRFIHLTNYSVNKLNVEYIDNHDNEACKGHKWSLKALWNYLRKRGVNTDHIWDKIKDLVVKTIISAEEMIYASVKTYCSSSYNAKEVFGFDVLLDENLKPWILEVNVSPSLHSDTPLDVAVKGAMVRDTLKLSGYMIPEVADIDPPITGFTKLLRDNQNPSSDLHIDLRFWLYKSSDDENAKSKYFESVACSGDTSQQFDVNNTLPYHILDRLTPADVRCLVDCYDEYERKGSFQRIFPISSTQLVKKYLSYCEKIRYSNLLVATFMTKYHKNGQDIQILEKLCQKKLHLLSAERGDKIDMHHIWNKPGY